MTTLDEARELWHDARVIPDRVLSALLARHDGDVSGAAGEWHGAPVELVAPVPVSAAPDPARPARSPRRRKGSTS